MSIYEYDYEKHMRQEREENFEAGREDGLTEGICAFIRLARRQGMSDALLREELHKEFSVSEQMIESCLGKDNIKRYSDVEEASRALKE